MSEREIKKSSKYLKKEGWIETIWTKKKIIKIGEKPICVCNLTGTTHFITGTIHGCKMAGGVVFKHADFCELKDKQGIWKQGIFKDWAAGDVIGWIFQAN